MAGHEVWDESAQAYSTYCDRSGHYRRLAKLLLTSAGVYIAQCERPRTKVALDLACGCGAATELLADLPHIERIYALDYSPAMLAEARRRLKSRSRVFYVLGSAEAVDTLLPHGSIDLVVCSASWWQFDDWSRVLTGLARVLRPSGRCALNLPDFSRTAAANPFRQAFYGLLQETGLPLPKYRPPDPDGPDLLKLAAKAGFDCSIMECDVLGSHADLAEFYQIPVMSHSLAPHLPPATRARLALQVRQKLEELGQAAPPARWLLVNLDRQAN